MYQHVLEALPVGAVLVGPEQRILAVNQQLLDWFRISQPDWQGRVVQRLFDALCQQAAEPKAARRALEEAAKKGAQQPRLEMVLQFPDRRHLLWIFFQHPGLGRREPVWGALVVDRTQEKTAAAKNDQLLQKVSAESLKAGTILQGNLQTLLENAEHWPPALIQEFLTQADNELREVHLLLDQLFALIQIRQADLRIFPRQTALREVLDPLLAGFPAGDQERSLEVALPEENLSAYLDPLQTRRVLKHLLSLALQHSREGSAVSLRGSSQGNTVSLSILFEPDELWHGKEKPTVEIFRPLDQRQFSIGEAIQKLQGGDLTLSAHPGDQAHLAFSATFPSRPPQGKLLAARGSPSRIKNTGRILVAESQVEALGFLKRALEEAGFRVDNVTSGASVLDMVQIIKPDLIILERELPPYDGLQVLTSLRRWSAVPVVMVSSREDPEELVRALAAGADEFLFKPYRMDELVARVQALLRRTDLQGEEAPEDVFQAEGLRINFNSRKVWRENSQLDLTPIEYNILAFLARHPRQVLTYEQIINSAWEGPDRGSRQGLFVHVSRLREKIEEQPKTPQLIKNHWGVGYIFQPE